MRGQIFLAASVLLAVALVLLAIETRPVPAPPSELLSETFRNLRAEYVRTVELSLLHGTDISADLLVFRDFATEALRRRGFEHSSSWDIDGAVTINLYLRLDSLYMLDRLTINTTVFR
jgi:hypothetical protein